MTLLSTINAFLNGEPSMTLWWLFLTFNTIITAYIIHQAINGKN